MNAEFNWWLLIVGLVVGAGLVWLVIADWSRREEDIGEDERAAESAWIAQTLRDRGEIIDPWAAEEILTLHRAYLRQSAGATEPTDDPADIAAWDHGAGTDTDTDADWADAPTEAVHVGTAPIDAAGPPAGRVVGDTAPAQPVPRSAAPAATMRATDPGVETEPPGSDRPSVRASRRSPRGGPGGPEFQPPA